MRFGSFVFSISADQNADHEVIGQTLREIEIAEEVHDRPSNVFRSTADPG